VETNSSLAKLLGCQPTDLRGREIASLAYNDGDAMRLRDGLDELRLTGDESLPQERMRLHHAADGQLWADVTLARLPGDAPGSAFPVVMVADANENHLLQERLAHQNVHDPLTGLPNASQFATKLEALLGTGSSEQIALVYLDIDGFKVINDGLGAGVGDQ